MKRTLRSGMSGSDVSDLGVKLIAFGHLDPAWSGDLFDSMMHTAVLSFQARHLDATGQPLVVDGVVGPVTWWALDNPKHVFIAPKSVPSIPSDPTAHPRHVAALKVGLGEMAKGCGESGANNSGPCIKKYLNGIVDPPQNWCAAGVSWCFLQSGEMPYPYSLGARDIYNKFEDRGWGYESGQKHPAPGDLVFWWRGMTEGWQGHIGFVLRLENGILTTLEANKGPFPSKWNTFTYVYSRMEKLLGFGRMTT